MELQDEARAAVLRRRGAVGLGVAAAAVSALGLTGPLLLATTGDPSPALPFYPLGWAVALGGWLYWLRSWRAGRRPPSA